ncbi:MAG: FHA domain-containing protein [Pirellulales bacterium]|nr:FHA domain-containing protein [Pirellulales bacterium]
MAQITLRVLSGADRGRTFHGLQTPMTIGREEGNDIQLNDERISRCHLKIQEDQGKIVLTDLESTNGTKVNGEDIQLRILRFGDVISLGRSVLLYGTREQIAARLAELRQRGLGETGQVVFDQLPDQLESPSLDFELHWDQNEDLHTTLHMPVPPSLPEHLSPGQAAEVSELLEFFHVRMRRLLAAIHVDENATNIQMAVRHWQAIVELEALLAEYLRAIGEP